MFKNISLFYCNTCAIKTISKILNLIRLHDAWTTYDRRAETKELVLDCFILFGFLYLIAFRQGDTKKQNKIVLSHKFVV